MKMRYLVLGVLAATLATAARGQQSSIEQRLEQLEQEIKLLKQQREADRAAAAEQTRKTPTVQADSNGVTVRSADTNFVFRLHGYVQADGRFYLADDARNGTDSFLLRRVRPIFEGTLFRDFDFRLMPDFASGQSLIQDAYLEWRYWPWMKVRAGKFKPPTGLERLQSDTWLFFAERGLPTDLTPDRDVGIQFSGDLFGGVVNYAGGVFNGAPDGTSADFDTYDSKDAAARIFVQPFKKTNIEPLKGLGLGIAGTIGNQQFTSTSTNLPSFKTAGQLTFFSYRSGVAPNGTQMRGLPQAYYYWGPLGLYGEYAVSQQDVQMGAVHNQMRNRAWQVQASFVLTGENATYNGVTPQHPFDLKNGGWGAWEIAARYGELHVDHDAFALQFADPTKSAQDACEWGIGLNWYLNRNVKWVLNYEQTTFNGGAGVTDNVSDREIERLLLTRFQVAF